MSHTPGPWTGSKIDPDGTWMIRCTEDDVRLFAAAPDLLTALEAIVQEAEPIYAMVPDRPPYDRAWALMKEARAAIAKAKGEADAG